MILYYRMKPTILNKVILLGLVLGLLVDAFQFAKTVPFSRYELVQQRQTTFLSSTRNLNENGESTSDLHSTLSSIDGVPNTLYHNKTEIEDDDDDDEGISVMSSVTHWSDIMRQDSWLQQQQQQQKDRKFENSSSISTMHAATNTNTIESVSSKSTRLDDVSALLPEELDQIEEYWDRLMPTVNYLGTAHVAQIYKALQVAYQAHRGQKRKSGEPFIIHVRCTWHCLRYRHLFLCYAAHLIVFSFILFM